MRSGLSLFAVRVMVKKQTTLLKTSLLLRSSGRDGSPHFVFPLVSRFGRYSALQVMNSVALNKIDGPLHHRIEQGPPDSRISVFVHLREGATQPPSAPGKWSHLRKNVFVVSAPVASIILVAQLECVQLVRCT